MRGKPASIEMTATDLKPHLCGRRPSRLGAMMAHERRVSPLHRAKADSGKARELMFILLDSRLWDVLLWCKVGTLQQVAKHQKILILLIRSDLPILTWKANPL